MADSEHLSATRDQVRARTAMYVGSTEDFGILNLLDSVLARSGGRALSGNVTNIQVSLGDDGTVSVREEHAQNVSEVATHPEPEIFASFDPQRAASVSPQERSPYTRLPVTSELAWLMYLSESVRITVCQNESVFRQVFADGFPVTKIESTAGAGDRGNFTEVRWKLDPQIFSPVQPKPCDVERRLWELAFLLPGTQFSLEYGADDRKNFQEPYGMLGLADCLSLSACQNSPPILASWHSPELHLDAALRYDLNSEQYKAGTRIAAFLNHRRMFPRGSQMVGALQGLADGFQAVRGDFPDTLPETRRITAESVRRGLSMAISIRYTGVIQFEGCTAHMLHAPEVIEPISQVMRDAVLNTVRNDPMRWRWILRSISERADSGKAAPSA